MHLNKVAEAEVSKLIKKFNFFIIFDTIQYKMIKKYILFIKIYIFFMIGVIKMFDKNR